MKPIPGLALSATPVDDLTWEIKLRPGVKFHNGEPFTAEVAKSHINVYPAEMRATRDLMRRRTHLMRKRAELLAHVQNTNSQYNLPEIGKKIAPAPWRPHVVTGTRYAAA